MYEIRLERRAEKDLRRLAAEIFQRVIAAIQGLANDPRPEVCKKLVDSGDDWRIRVGDYRVLYEVDDQHQVVRIMRVRHRRDAYR